MLKWHVVGAQITIQGTTSIQRHSQLPPYYINSAYGSRNSRLAAVGEGVSIRQLLEFSDSLIETFTQRYPFNNRFCFKVVQSFLPFLFTFFDLLNSFNF